MNKGEKCKVTRRLGLLTLGLVMVLALAVGLMLPRARADAKAKVVTVTKIDQATAKKVHKLLLKGDPFTVRFKCSEERFYSKFQKLTNKVAKCTDEGFDIFPLCMNTSRYFGLGGGGRNPKQSGGYTSFRVIKLDCQEYKYGIKYARREKKNFTAYVDKALQQTTALIEQLEQPDIYMADEAKDKAATLEGLRSTEKNLGDLSSYLHKTKFRNLSEAMKARITLGIGMADDWRIGSMGYKYGMDTLTADKFVTFKKLFERKALGSCGRYASVTCKICAAFHIGTFDMAEGEWGGGGHAVVAVQIKTLGGKKRYLLINNGRFSRYNSFSYFEIIDVYMLYQKADRKKLFKKLGKISKNQEFKDFDFYAGSIGTYQIIDGGRYYMDMKYNEFSIPRSEW